MRISLTLHGTGLERMKTVQSTKITNKLEEKLKLIDVDSSLSVSILRTLISVSGSAEDLNSESESLEFNEISHFVKITTTNEFQNPKYSEIHEYYSQDALRTSVTHMVTG